MRTIFFDIYRQKRKIEEYSSIRHRTGNICSISFCCDTERILNHVANYLYEYKRKIAPQYPNKMYTTTLCVIVNIKLYKPHSLLSLWLRTNPGKKSGHCKSSTTSCFHYIRCRCCRWYRFSSCLICFYFTFVYLMLFIIKYTCTYTLCRV